MILVLYVLSEQMMLRPSHSRIVLCLIYVNPTLTGISWPLEVLSNIYCSVIPVKGVVIFIPLRIDRLSYIHLEILV